MSGGLILDNIIMNLFSDITEQTKNLEKNNSFFRLQDDKILLIQRISSGLFMGKKN